MKDMIGYCGLDCEKCDAYCATINNDELLREKTAQLWSKLNNTTILPKDINCYGCRMNGVKTIFCESICEVRRCALKNGVCTCGDCAKLQTCTAIGSIISNNPVIADNLKNK